MNNAIKLIKKNKNLVIMFSGILLLFIFLYLIFGGNKYFTIEGTIIDIYYKNINQQNPTVLIRNDDGIFSVRFKKDISLRKKGIELNSIVSVSYTGGIMESYPAQVNGIDIESTQKPEKKFDIKNSNMYFLSGDGSYSDDSLEFDYHRFKTKVFKTKGEYLLFANKRNITTHIDNNINLDNVFKDSMIAISYSYMSSMPTIIHFGTYKINDNIFIQINIESQENMESQENITDDLAFRGTMIILKNNFVTSDNIETLSEYTTIK